MLPEKVVEHLRHVLAEEQVPFDEESLWLLGRAADGSMRDGLSLTDQAIAFGNGQLQVAEVRSMLGTIDHGQVFGLLQALAAGDARALLAAVAELAEQGADFAGVLAELISTLQRVAIAQVLPEAADNSLGDQARVLELAGQVSAEDVQLFYQLALHGRRDLPLAPDPRGGFEMALLRMLAFRPGTLQHTGNAIPAGLAQTPPATQPSPAPAALGDPGKAPGISQAAADSDTARPTTQAAPVTAPAAVMAPTEPTSATPLAVAPMAEPSAPPAPESQATVSPTTAPTPVVEEPTASNEPPNPPVAAEPPEWLQDAPPDDSFNPGSDEELDVSDYLSDWEPAADSATAKPGEEDVSDLPPATGLAAQWLELYPRLGVAGLTQSIAAHCQLVAVDDAVWQLHLDPGHSALYNENHRQRLEKAITELQEQSVTLVVTVQPPTQETPAVAAARRRVARQKEAEASIQGDPLVQALINDFAAQICDDSIRPLDA